MDIPPTGWFDIAEWVNCRQMERPGYVFEVQNAEGLAVQTNCTPTISFPPDWPSPPSRFRLIPEVPPQHSDPIPLPVDRT